ncbi:MAG: DUF1573 domain-containing protein [Bacteroidales bacterium]|nr:DUF1573 domain-containing protein [Bacteroidales bacterium]MBO7567007.1 DUF1573 domain-containing protein [Bacteroidales bacterium]MBP5683264.1 DUF1573 domain-containing protein [Bacteroidales bacterium]
MYRICILLTFVAMMIMSSCGGNNANSGTQSASSADSSTKDTTLQPEIEFDTAVFDFGTILQGEQVGTTFTFKNTGKADLIIRKVETSCGCTVPEYDRAPVAPGMKGTIRVRFDSDGKEGAQYKTIKVVSNCKDNIFELVLKGTVKTND